MKRFLHRLLPAPVVRRLREWRNARVLRRFRPYAKEAQFGTTRLQLWLPDPMAEAWYGGGGDDLPEFPPLRRGKLRPGATVFNLGAHHGVVALRLAAEVAPGGIVVAVEANPVSAAAARRNAALNSEFPIIVENVAVGATSGTIQVSSDWGSQSVGAGEHRIPLVTIDELAARHGSPDVVYIDIEGWEQAALEGGLETLDKGPDWCVEVHAGCGLEEAGGTVGRIVSLFTERGYDLRAVDDGVEIVPLTCENDERVPSTRFHLIASMAYNRARGGPQR